MNERSTSPAAVRLLDALSEGLSLTDILSIAAEMVGNPVIFDDVMDRIKATSRDADLDAFYQQSLGAGEKVVPENMLERNRKDKVGERLLESPEPIKTYDDVFDCEWIFAYVVVNGTIVGNVLTRSMHRPLSEEDRLVMGTLAWVISLYLQCQGENEEMPMSEMYFLYNLLNRNQVNDQTLPKWYAHMDWRPSGQMRVAVFRSRADEAEDIEWSYYLEMIKRYHPNSILCTYENSIVLLQSLNGNEDQTTNAAFEHTLYSSALVAGYGRPVSDLNDVHKAYRQARNAIRFGLKTTTHGSVFHYEDHVLNQMVEICSRDQKVLFELCHPAIFRLLQYDREHGTEFYDTLDTFFRLSNNLAKLSEEMRIHRNTAYYRMSKIYQITGVDLRGDPSVLRLQFSFELLRNRQNKLPDMFV